MHIIRTVAAEAVIGYQVIDDFIKPAFQTVLIPADEFEHIRWQRYLRVRRTFLEGCVGRIEFHDDAVTQDNTHCWSAVYLECADLERFCNDLRKNNGRTGQRYDNCDQ